jgi:hypothetical protein
MARTQDVVPVLVGWLVWDWFFGDAEGEEDGNDEEPGVVKEKGRHGE